MSVGTVGASDAITYTSNSEDTSKTNSKVDTETFLNLLVAQLKYQDPLEPQDNTAFVTQLAQMSSLSEMQDMKSTLQNSQAYDMIGKDIYAEVLDKTTGVTNAYAGIVDSVIIRDGIPYIVVGSTAIRVSDVKQVFPVQEQDSATDNATDGTTI
ncbi:hypothetical protein IZU99_08690 [Oscillospiraceae bacterium CM]|nr:hypothetical protein IZU99_08690 [Oscillospiraceae bacterium CM]